MKKIISTVLSIIIVVSVFTVFPTVRVSSKNIEISESGKVQAGTCGESLNWTLDISTGEFNLSGTGTMPDFSSSDKSPWYNYRYAIKTATIAEGITNIGDEAFYYCVNMTAITIPDSVESIGNWSFASCGSLNDFEISKNITTIGKNAFYGCSEIKTMTIPDNVESIGYCAFYHCSNLESVTIGKGVTKIDDTAFLSCDRLAKIRVEYGNTSYSSQDDVLFDQNKTYLIQYPAGRDKGAYEIPETVRKINPIAFYNCQKLIQINVDIQNKFFASEGGVLFNAQKTELIQYPVGNITKSYSVPSGVLSINNDAFKNCEYLTDVTLPDSLTSIGVSAFSECANLKNIKLPLGVTSIGSYAFYYCKSLEGINIPDGVEKIPSIAFNGCTSLKSIVIYDGVKSIESFAFDGCKALSDVYYTGDEYDWDKINIGTNNSPLTNATIHFNHEKETTAQVTTSTTTQINPSVPTESETTESTVASTTEPLTTKPSTTEPSTTEPLTTEPLTTEPLTTEPLATQPLITEPVTTKPTEATAKPQETTSVPTEPTTNIHESTVNNTKITLKRTSVKIYIKGKIKIAYKVKKPKGTTKFTSSNKTIAKVSKNGVVTGLKAGKARITLKNNGVKKVLKVTVKKPVVKPKSKVIRRGKSFTIKITGKVGKAKFKSRNKKIAKVNSKGKVVAKRKGKTTIIIKTNGLTYKCKVTVK